jgi:hypothetical protein
LDILEKELDLNRIDVITIDDIAQLNQALKAKRALSFDEE